MLDQLSALASGGKRSAKQGGRPFATTTVMVTRGAFDATSGGVHL